MYVVWCTWFAGIVCEITPEAGGVRCVDHVAQVIPVVAHVVAGAVASYGGAVPTQGVTCKPRRTLTIGSALVRVAHIVMANL